MAIWKAFFLAFSALLPLINPFGSALVFLGLMGDAPPALYRSVARQIAVNNIIFLGVIELLGSAILTFFGISLPVVQVAGGIVIAAIAWNILNKDDSRTAAQAKELDPAMPADLGFHDLERKAFYPFTFPVTSGPGALVTMFTLTAHMSGRTLSDDLLGHLGVFCAVVVLSVLVYFCYAYAPKIAAKMPPSVAQGILRVIAFILLCIGVQIAWNGISVLLKTVLRA